MYYANCSKWLLANSGVSSTIEKQFSILANHNASLLPRMTELMADKVIMTKCFYNKLTA